MFRISFMTDDKKLARALVALDGLAFNLEVTPAHPVGNKPNGKSPKMNAAEWVKRLPKQFSWSDLKAELKKDGRASSTSSIAATFVQKRLIKKTKGLGRYERIA